MFGLVPPRMYKTRIPARSVVAPWPFFLLLRLIGRDIIRGSLTSCDFSHVFRCQDSLPPLSPLKLCRHSAHFRAHGKRRGPPLLTIRGRKLIELRLKCIFIYNISSCGSSVESREGLGRAKQHEGVRFSIKKAVLFLLDHLRLESKGGGGEWRFWQVTSKVIFFPVGPRRIIAHIFSPRVSKNNLEQISHLSFRIYYFPRWKKMK